MGHAGLGSAPPDQVQWRADPGPVDGIDLFAQHSAERTGGDLFDTVRIGPRVAFFLSDIAGRRPELGPIAAEMQQAFRTSSETLLRAPDMNLMEATEALVVAINQALVEVANGARFTPTMVGCYDVQLGVLAYINAGGQTALFQDSEGTRVLPNASVPLGLFTHFTYDASIQAFEPDARLLVVTKGVTESMGSKTPFGPERLVELMQTSKDGTASGLCGAVMHAARQSAKRPWGWLPFRGEIIREDMTAVAMRRTIPPST